MAKSGSFLLPTITNKLWLHSAGHAEKYGNKMSTRVSLESFADKMSSINVVKDVWQELMDFVEPLGIDALSYYHKPPPGAADFSDKHFVSLGFDKALEEEHRRQHTLFAGAFTSNINTLLEPILWEDLSEKLLWTPAQLKHLHAFYAPFPANGIIVPVYGPNSRNGCVVMRFSDQDCSFAKESVYKVHFASNQCHLQFCKIMAKNADNPVILTEREREVLTWVARGKSNAVIAEIVGISHHTVNGYLRRVYLKTQTSDRTTAALRAVGDGLIDF